MPKESLRLVEAGGGTGLKITSEPLTERISSRIRRALPLQSELEWPQGKKSGTAEVFAFVSLDRRRRCFFICTAPKPPLEGRWHGKAVTER